MPRGGAPADLHLLSKVRPHICAMSLSTDSAGGWRAGSGARLVSKLGLQQGLQHLSRNSLITAYVLS